MTLFSTQGHPTTDAFEEYAFKRLSEAETEALEEHVLICPECQTSLAEVDEYILMMKQATARYEPRLQPAHRGAGIRAVPTAALLGRKGPNRSLTYSIGLIAAAASILLVFAPRMMERRSGPTERAAASVELLALRGGGPAANHTPSGRPVDLTIDSTGLAVDSTAGGVAEKYRVEIVNTVGEPVWNGEVAGSAGSVSAHLTKGLKPGQYWVRLYSSDKLLREFGLRVD